MTCWGLCLGGGALLRKMLPGVGQREQDNLVTTGQPGCQTGPGGPAIGLHCRYNHSARKNKTKFFAELSPHWSTTNPHHFIAHYKDFSSTNHLCLFVTLSPLSTESF